MCILKIGPYTIIISRISKTNLNNHFFLQKSYVFELYKKNLITKTELDHAIYFLNK